MESMRRIVVNEIVGLNGTAKRSYSVPTIQYFGTVSEVTKAGAASKPEQTVTTNPITCSQDGRRDCDP